MAVVCTILSRPPHQVAGAGVLGGEEDGDAGGEAATTTRRQSEEGERGARCEWRTGEEEIVTITTYISISNHLLKQQL